MHVLKKIFSKHRGGSLAKLKAHSLGGHNKPVVNVLFWIYLIFIVRIFNTSLFAALS